MSASEMLGEPLVGPLENDGVGGDVAQPTAVGAVPVWAVLAAVHVVIAAVNYAVGANVVAVTLALVGDITE